MQTLRRPKVRDRVAGQIQRYIVAALPGALASPHMQSYRVNFKEYVRGMQLLVLDPAE